PLEDQPYIGGAGGTSGGVACMDGPNKGEKCGAEANPEAFCETSPGSNDGHCDACPVMGGFTTEDEMFILIGSYFIPEPASSQLLYWAILTLTGLAARRSKRA
ncbi:MAG: hypothetical protein VCC04_07900, partial [Myxococcota bacterium]